jgi:hypothetical protein
MCRDWGSVWRTGSVSVSAILKSVLVGCRGQEVYVIKWVEEGDEEGKIRMRWRGRFRGRASGRVSSLC